MSFEKYLKENIYSDINPNEEVAEYDITMRIRPKEHRFTKAFMGRGVTGQTMKNYKPTPEQKAFMINMRKDINKILEQHGLTIKEFIWDLNAYEIEDI